MISIIVPVLNEEKKIETLLKKLNELKGKKEIIVVDGGSIDKTVSISKEYAKVVTSKKGRSFQMNKGINVSTGEIVWFVHSDSLVHENSLDDIIDTINEGYVGGGFSLYFYDYNTKFMKFLSYSSNLRAKYLGLFFGDQGIFLRRDVLKKLNGFREIDIMEDFDLSRRLKKDYKIKILNTPIGTSGRRFKNGGQLKTLLLMHKLKILFLLNVSPEKLNKMYREAR